MGEQTAKYLLLFIIICLFSFFVWSISLTIEYNQLKRECHIICKYNDYKYLGHNLVQCQCSYKDTIKRFQFKK